LRGGYRISKETRLEAGCDNLFDKLYYHPMGGSDLLEDSGTPGSRILADLHLIAAPGRTCYTGIVAKF
jgi:outer membrane receptor for ferrienterochelin and colicin